MSSVANYIKRIWTSRYFWLHLVNADLKYKFRRSRIGLLWTMINPLSLMLMISIIFSVLFKTPLEEFAPYVYSGLVVWNYMLASTIIGSGALISSEAYIKQFNHPLMIYCIRANLVGLISFLIEIVGLLIWYSFINISNVLFLILQLFIVLPILFLFGLPLTIITSFLTLRYRDFGQLTALLMQMIYFLSPIFLDISLFEQNNLYLLLYYNPITHLMNLVRMPLLNGKFICSVDVLFSVGFSFVLWIIALVIIRKMEKQSVFYF